MPLTATTTAQHKLLSEDRVLYLIQLAEDYASSKNLSAIDYVSAVVNPDTMGNHDIYEVVETLIKYHLDWLGQKSNYYSKA